MSSMQCMSGSVTCLRHSSSLLGGDGMLAHVHFNVALEG